MLKNAPPGTELIIAAFSVILSLILVFGLMYSWLIMGSQTIGMVFVGLIVFILIMLGVYLARKGDGEDNEDDDFDDETDSSVSLDPNDGFDENK